MSETLTLDVDTALALVLQNHARNIYELPEDVVKAQKFIVNAMANGENETAQKIVETIVADHAVTAAHAQDLYSLFRHTIAWWRLYDGWYFDSGASRGSGAVIEQGPFESLSECRNEALKAQMYHSSYGIKDIRPYKMWKVSAKQNALCMLLWQKCVQ